jgi:hypothetical protein
MGSSITDKLKDDIECLIEGPLLPLDDDLKQVLQGLLRTLQYYSISYEYKEYYAGIATAVQSALAGPKGITIHDVYTKEDGSTAIDFEVDKQQSEQLICQGMLYVLQKAALSANDEQMFIWAEAGKQQLQKKT